MVKKLLKLGRGFHTEARRVLRHAEYQVRKIWNEYSEEVIEFQYNHLKASNDPPSRTFEEFKQDFYYNCCVPDFSCLAALKNTPEYMEGIKLKIKNSGWVQRQKPSWFTEERKKQLGMVNENKRLITDDMGFVLGSANLWVKQNACEVFKITPLDQKWCSKRAEDAHVKVLASDPVKGIGIDRELFYFAKRIATENNMNKIFMALDDDDAGLKFAAKVGLEVVATTTETKKILVGKILTPSDLTQGLGTYVEW